MPSGSIFSGAVESDRRWTERDSCDPLFWALDDFVADEGELTFSVDFNSVGSEDPFGVALLEASLASVSLFGKSSSDMASLSRVWFQAADPAPDRMLSRLGGDVCVLLVQNPSDPVRHFTSAHRRTIFCKRSSQCHSPSQEHLKRKCDDVTAVTMSQMVHPP